MLMAAALGCTLPGCAWYRSVFGPQTVAQAPCVLPPDASVEQIVDHLNANTARLNSWRTTRARISTRTPEGLPLNLEANVAVAAPRNFRLRVNGPMGAMGGTEVDLGSNEDHFWFWNKRNHEKNVFTAKHDAETGRVRHFPIPFQPDWIMEALGVRTIDVEEVSLEPGPPGSSFVTLWAERASPQGYRVRKETLIDTCRGVVRRHALYDARGQLVAKAELNNHVPDKTTGVLLPTRIDLDWPQAKLKLTMWLSDVEVNPRRIADSTWVVPEIPGYEIKDLSR